MAPAAAWQLAIGIGQAAFGHMVNVAHDKISQIYEVHQIASPFWPKVHLRKTKLKIKKKNPKKLTKKKRRGAAWCHKSTGYVSKHIIVWVSCGCSVYNFRFDLWAGGAQPGQPTECAAFLISQKKLIVCRNSAKIQVCFKTPLRLCSTWLN